jgi:hypothetical protein
MVLWFSYGFPIKTTSFDEPFRVAGTLAGAVELLSGWNQRFANWKITWLVVWKILLFFHILGRIIPTD